jgi:ferric-dicitrate binding protein FerR (iron transport regulator)
MNESSQRPGDMPAALEEAELRKGLSSVVLTADAWQRVRSATEEEWRRNVVPPGLLRGRRQGRIAAGIVALAIVGAVAFWNVAARDAAGPLMAHLERAESPGVSRLRAWRADLPVPAGAGMRVGQTFEARGVSLVTLIGGGNLRLAPAAVFEIEGADQVRLESGEIYVDIPPDAHRARVFVARTAAGEFRHVGTQFALAVIDGTTRLRVREGTVQWRTADGNTTVVAGTEIKIGGGRKVATRRIQSTGHEFAWTETVTPDVDIDNRPLSEFLNWVARETGRKLVFADEEARRRTSTIRMHGDVRGLTTMQALSTVMAASTLRFDLPDGAIRLSFTEGPPPLPRK